MSIPKKPRKCRVCKSDFQPVRCLQQTCSFDCEVKLGLIHAERSKAKREKAERIAEIASTKILREKLKTKRDWMKEAQAAFNAYRRELFRDEPCISCGRYHSGQYHAGHYMSTGAHPELRFEEINVWKQCQPCNTHLSGNLINYRKALINRIGVEKVDWLEGYHEPKKYSIDDLKSIAKEYRIKLANIRSNSNE